MADTQNTESIRDLIAKIDSRNVALPEFQRNFVWDLSKTYDLFDSLIRDIFIGSIIYGIPSFEISTRQIDTRPRTGKGSRKKLGINSYSQAEINKLVKTEGFRLILDGQQRSTALYRALKGLDEVWFLAIDEGELFKNDGTNINLEGVLEEIAGEESSERLSIRLSDIYKMMDGQIRRESEKQDLLKASSYCSSNSIDSTRFDQLFESYLAITDKFQDLLKADKLVSYYLLDTSIDKFSLFFERSNSKGIRLNFIDILAAKLYSGFNLRQMTDEFEGSNPTVDLNREIVVRSIASVVSQGKELGRAWILKNLTSDHFKSEWGNSVQLYVRSIGFLQENRWILKQRLMPYEAMLIPMMEFLRNLPSREFSQASADQMRYLRWWYWSSIFSQRYASRTISIMTDDSRTLGAIARSERPLEKNYHRRFEHPYKDIDHVLDLTSPASAVFRGVLTLIGANSGGLVDWRNGSMVSPEEKIDNHHIFPREFLTKSYKGAEDEALYVDSVANRTLIPKITNIKIGKKLPSHYLADLAAHNPKLSDALGAHLVDKRIIDGNFDSDFYLFLLERAILISELIGKETRDTDTILKPFQAS